MMKRGEWCVRWNDWTRGYGVLRETAAWIANHESTGETHIIEVACLPWEPQALKHARRQQAFEHVEALTQRNQA